jgi:hypothetical protein
MSDDHHKWPKVELRRRGLDIRATVDLVRGNDKIDPVDSIEFKPPKRLKDGQKYKPITRGHYDVRIKN